MLASYGSVDGVRVLEARETVELALSDLLPAGVRRSEYQHPDTDKAEGYGAGGWVYLADAPHGVRAEPKAGPDRPRQWPLSTPPRGCE